MSAASDIRMYVEHLFEGRTLTSEAIELKEEIYGNLMARYEDYVAQGMGEDEAYRLTCEAVTSVDDFIGEKDGEKDAPAEGQASASAGATEAMPAFAPAPESGTGSVAGAPVPPGSPDAATPRRWSVGKIVAVVAGTLVVGIAAYVAMNALNLSQASQGYQGQTSQTVQQIDGTSTDLALEDPSQTTGGGGGAGSTTGGGQADGAAQGSADDLSDQIYAVSPTALAQTPLSAASPDAEAVADLARTLPLGSYFAGTGTREGSDQLQLTYNYQSDDERDRIARDDDCVDRALVFNAVVLMCTTSDLNTLVIQEIELDDNDTDEHVFERSAVEDVLGVRLDADQLTDESWPALREQLMTKRVWDRIWERADRD